MSLEDNFYSEVRSINFDNSFNGVILEYDSNKGYRLSKLSQSNLVIVLEYKLNFFSEDTSRFII